MRRFLVQPDAGGRISGGYLYNQRMVEHAPAAAPITLVDVPVAVAPGHLTAMDAGDVVLADSLFLHPERLAPFLALAARGVRVGMLLHALPSFIERAAAGQVSHEPTASEAALLDQLDLVVVPGPYLHGVLGPRIATPIAICLPGIDDAWRRATPPAAPEAHPGRALMLLSVGAVTPNKGFDDVVDALARLAPGPHGPHVRWRIAGSTDVDPGYSAHLRRRIERAGLSGQVEILGQRPVDETRALFAAADVFVLASYTENHPLTALEALASCVPTIAYAVGGLPVIVRDGETGLLAAVRDVDALARHLGRLLDDAALRQRMAMRAWELRHSLLSWPEAAAALALALAPQAS
jgi:glycosyltransferase involved in cell wall biosynthesis